MPVRRFPVLAPALAVLAAALAAAPSSAQPPPARPAPALAETLAHEPLRLGTAWYPEQWPESRWETDLALMQAAHIDVVRIAEFAWSSMEPRGGQYDFGWLDRAIAAAARHHIQVVLGTPTAAPPAWLTSHYPDTLRVGEDGKRDEHGNREQFSFASRRYRQFARDIAERMAERYGDNPNVIGWQIDNEINPASFDDEAKAQWHGWLAAKYGNVAALNDHWTTAYWSQTYDDFAEVPMHSKAENPGLLLDFKRFVTDTWISYVDNQVQAIRAHANPRQFITTNTMHWNAGYDHYRLHQGLDLAAWDDYVPDGHLDWLDNAAQHDQVRGYKRRNFWVMETQPAFVNWWPTNRSLDPGVVRDMAWQAVGHGADAVLYWQWRSALGGQEQYHGTLLGADGTPVPVYAEVARTGAEFARASDALAGTSPHARVAVIQDYDSRWAIDFQRHSKDFDPIKELEAFYRPLERKAQAVDVVSPEAPLDRYALVVAPALNVLTDAEARRLADYVRGGGHLVLGPRSGMKDGFNALHVERQPGPLAELLGGRVEQFYPLDAPQAVSGETGAGEAKIWAEALSAHAPDTHVEARYGAANTWLDGQPAILSRKVGRGTVTYVGAWLDDALMARLADRWLGEAGVAPILAGAPEAVEVCERSGGGRRVLVLINHADAPRSLTLPSAMTDVLAGGQVSGAMTLGSHEVRVLSGPAA